MKFRTKTVLGVAFIELSLLAILVISTLYLLERSNKHEINSRVEITSRLLKASLKDAMIAYDLATLNAVVDDAMKTEDIVYLRIMDRKGRIMAKSASAPSEDTLIPQDETLEDVQDSVFDTRVIIAELGQDFGEIEYGVNLTSFETVLKQARNQTAMIAALEIVLVAIFSLLLGTYLTRSLYNIQVTSQRIAEGDMTARTEVKGNDELAETANAFNIMADILEQRAKDRDIALQKAEEANKAKTQFLASMSHELRTPLNSIIGFTRRLRKNLEEDIEPRHLDALTTIEKNGTHLLMLINTILDLSKISAGKMEVFPESFQLKAFLECMIQDLSEPNEPHQLLLSGLCDDLKMHTDPLKLKQVLINYVSNARKYSPPGNIEIKTSHCQLNDALAVKIAVIDGGKGVPEEESENLFTQFSQFDTFKHRNVQGTGLGLSLVAQLAATLKGSVHYSRTSDDRTEFAITIPIIYPAE